MNSKAYVYSVNPSDIMVSVGQFGNIMIAGAGKKLFGRTPIEGRVLLKDLGNDNFQPYEETADSIVHDIATRYSEQGLFEYPGKDEPSPETVSTQIAKFRAHCVALTRHADALWDRKHDRELIDESARRAARYLNLNPPWADAVAEETKECPYCAEVIKARAQFCKHCRKDLGEQAQATAKK